MIQNKTIKVFNTHIEIEPYRKGEEHDFEYGLSIWNSHTFKLIPVGYQIQGNTLFIPRGISTGYLRSVFKSEITYMRRSDPTETFKAEMTLDPRDEIQVDAIDFLTEKSKSAKSSILTQFILQLDTGLGKTYTMIHTIINRGVNAIIITHQELIKKQWYDTFLRATTLTKDDIIDFTGTDTIERYLKSEDKKCHIFLANHQTLNSYFKKVGYKGFHDLFKELKVGIKVYDEAHKFFSNILTIDYYTNTWQSYYLTATFDRANPYERIIYKKAFSNAVHYGENADKDIDPHILLYVIRYHSSPTQYDRIHMVGAYGFSSYNFIDYALSEPGRMLPSILEMILDKVMQYDGKILITSPKIESVERIKDLVENYTDQQVSTIHSGNTKKENEEARNCNIISSTIQSIGTGADIKDLRTIINLEPISYPGLASQLRGRLRKIEGKDSFLFYPLDLSIPGIDEMFKKILPVMKKKCKEIYYIDT